MSLIKFRYDNYNRYKNYEPSAIKQFFTWIAVDSNVSEKTKEDRGFFLIKGNIEYIKLAAIVIVFGVFLVFVISLILKIFSIY